MHNYLFELYKLHLDSLLKFRIAIGSFKNTDFAELDRIALERAKESLKVYYNA